MIKDIWKEMRRIDSSTKKLREFGLTMAGMFALVSLWCRHKHHDGALAWTVGASAFFLFWFLVRPAALKPVQKIWMGLAVLLGFFVGRILLSTLFFAAFTPVALVLRAKGRDVLQQKPDPALKTYWTEHADRSDNRAQYERQY